MAILFEHVTAVTMDEERRILKDAYVSVEGTKISFVGLERPQGEFQRVIDGTGKVLMPGLINAHTHLPMTLMRGYGGGGGVSAPIAARAAWQAGQPFKWASTAFRLSSLQTPSR